MLQDKFMFTIDELVAEFTAKVIAEKNAEFAKKAAEIEAEYAKKEADLIAAEEMADRTNVPEIKEAVARIRALSADEKARDIANRRELTLQEKTEWEKKLKEANESLEKAKKEITLLEMQRIELEKKDAALYAEFEEFMRRK